MNNSKVVVVIIHRIRRVLQKWCSRWSTVACKCLLIVPNSADSLFLLLPFPQKLCCLFSNMLLSVTRCVLLAGHILWAFYEKCWHFGLVAWYINPYTFFLSFFSLSVSLSPSPPKQKTKIIILIKTYTCSITVGQKLETHVWQCLIK